MIKKIGDQVIKILKNNLLFFVFFFISLFLFTFELPYYIKTTGGVIDITTRVKTNKNSNINGKYYMAYVSELKATLPTYLISKVNKKWDLIPKEKEVSINESEEDALFRNKTLLKESIQNAIYIAYNKANKKTTITDIKNYVVYIDPIAKTDLKVGDVILEVNNQKIKTKNDIYQITSLLKKGDKINLKVKNNNKIYNRTAEMILYKNKIIIGILISENYKLETEPKIEFSFKKSESGSSGGLMMSLTIYDLLSDIDLAKDRKIAGTGTIDKNGIVGDIDGVSYKLGGAVKEGADIFFVPAGDNYEEAIKIQDKFNYDIEIVRIETIDDAIEYLKN